MSLEPLFVLGGGGHAKVVISLLRSLDREIAAVLDDDPAVREVLGVPLIGVCDLLLEQTAPLAILAMGDNRSRQLLARKYAAATWTSLVHPAAHVDADAKLGPGSVVMAGAVIQAGSTVGSHCIINTNATVDHDCLLGDFVHVASGATLTGGVRLGEGVFFGAGATCLPGLLVEEWSVVGAGAVVSRPVPARSLAKGVPARHLPL